LILAQVFVQTGWDVQARVDGGLIDSFGSIDTGRLAIETA
jgi:hypothetical protein